MNLIQLKHNQLWMQSDQTKFRLNEINKVKDKSEKERQ